MESSNQIVKAIVLDRRKAHFDQITSIAVNPDNASIIATTSDDLTIRIWDLRVNSSVKLIKHKQLSSQLSNCTFSSEGGLLVASGRKVYGFELRKEAVFVSTPQHMSQGHLDQINHIAFNKDFSLLGACDDMGDGRLYTSTLQTVGELDQKHKNISFCLDFINPDNKPSVCVTSGFDCRLVFWDTVSCEAIREIEVAQIMTKLVPMHCPPLVYCVLGLQASVLIGTETGHVCEFKLTGPKQPRLIFEASLNKILRLTFCAFKKNIMLTLSSDNCFTLFDFQKRTSLGAPIFIQKYATPEVPNWIETTPDNVILIADKSNQLLIYRIKG